MRETAVPSIDKRCLNIRPPFKAGFVYTKKINMTYFDVYTDYLVFVVNFNRSKKMTSEQIKRNMDSLQREIDGVQRQYDSEKRTFDNYMKQAQNSQKKLDDYTKKMNEKRKKMDQLQKDFNKAVAEELKKKK